MPQRIDFFGPSDTGVVFSASPTDEFNIMYASTAFLAKVHHDPVGKKLESVLGVQTMARADVANVVLSTARSGLPHLELQVVLHGLQMLQQGMVDLAWVVAQVEQSAWYSPPKRTMLVSKLAGGELACILLELRACPGQLIRATVQSVGEFGECVRGVLETAVRGPRVMDTLVKDHSSRLAKATPEASSSQAKTFQAEKFKQTTRGMGAAGTAEAAPSDQAYTEAAKSAKHRRDSPATSSSTASSQHSPEETLIQKFRREQLTSVLFRFPEDRRVSAASTESIIADLAEFGCVHYDYLHLPVANHASKHRGFGFVNFPTVELACAFLSAAESWTLGRTHAVKLSAAVNQGVRANIDAQKWARDYQNPPSRKHSPQRGRCGLPFVRLGGVLVRVNENDLPRIRAEYW